MIGLIKKDYFNIASSLKVYLLIPAMFAFLSYTNKSMDMLAFGTCFIAIFVIISCFAYDDMAHFNDYALTLPINRKDLVLSKYMLANIFMIVIFLLANLVAFGLNLMFPGRFQDYQVMDFMEYTFLATMIVNLLTSIILIIMFKFGSEKGRIVFIVCFLVIGLLGGLLGNVVTGIPVEKMIAFLDEYLTILAFPLSVLAEIICIPIAIKIVEHKEM